MNKIEWRTIRKNLVSYKESRKMDYDTETKTGGKTQYTFSSLLNSLSYKYIYKLFIFTFI